MLVRENQVAVVVLDEVQVDGGVERIVRHHVDISIVDGDVGVVSEGFVFAGAVQVEVFEFVAVLGVVFDFEDEPEVLWRVDDVFVDGDGSG